MSEIKKETVNQPKRNLSWLWLILVVIAVAAAVYFYMQLSASWDSIAKMEKEKEYQRVALQTELDSLMSQHSIIKLEYGNLADSLVAKEIVIEQNAAEIKRLLNTEWEYYKVKKKLDQLRNITQGYLKQMDSLYVVNEELIAENEMMREQVVSTEKMYNTLNQEKEAVDEKIAEAAVFKGHDINIWAYRTKGRGERVPTDKAKKMMGVQVKLTLADNSLITKGQKVAYARIAGPDKAILCKGDGDEYSFDLDGAQLQYSMKESFNYTGEPVELDMVWNKVISSQRFEAGEYAVDLYIDGNKIVTRSFTVK